MDGDFKSRSALIEQLKENLDDRNIQDSLEFFGVYDIINSQPTAYDVDKAVEELEEYSSRSVCGRFSGGCPYIDNPDIQCENCAIMVAIEIVKAGGINERG